MIAPTEQTIAQRVHGILMRAEQRQNIADHTIESLFSLSSRRRPKPIPICTKSVRRKLINLRAYYLNVDLAIVNDS